MNKDLQLTSAPKKTKPKKKPSKQRKSSPNKKKSLYDKAIDDSSSSYTERGAIRVPTGLGALAFDVSVDAYPAKHFMAAFIGMTPENKDDTGARGRLEPTQAKPCPAIRAVLPCCIKV